MNVVPVKCLIEYNQDLLTNTSGLHSIGLQDSYTIKVNSCCEIAVEEAVSLKEKGFAKEVIIVSVTPYPVEEKLRNLLALGADRVVNIRYDKFYSSITIAYLIYKISVLEKPDLVLCGQQSLDQDQGHVPQMLAAFLKYPQAISVSAISIVETNQLSVVEDLDYAKRYTQLRLPAVVSVDNKLNEPRYIKLPDIISAENKPYLSVHSSSLFDGNEPDELCQELEIRLPEPRKPAVFCQDIDKLIFLLKEKHNL